MDINLFFTSTEGSEGRGGDSVQLLPDSHTSPVFQTGVEGLSLISYLELGFRFRLKAFCSLLLLVDPERGH